MVIPSHSGQTKSNWYIDGSLQASSDKLGLIVGLYSAGGEAAKSEVSGFPPWIEGSDLGRNRKGRDGREGIVWFDNLSTYIRT